jgi:hypothetical protein
MQDTQADAIRQAMVQIDKATPNGWRGRPPCCRACGREGRADGSRWATVSLVRRLERESTLLYSFAMLCGSCAADQGVIATVSNAVFAPGAPPAPLGAT